MLCWNNNYCGYCNGYMYAPHRHITRCRQGRRVDVSSTRSFSPQSPQDPLPREAVEIGNDGRQFQPYLRHGSCYAGNGGDTENTATVVLESGNAMSTVHDMEEVSASDVVQQGSSAVPSVLSDMLSNRINSVVMKSSLKSASDCKRNSKRL